MIHTFGLLWTNHSRMSLSFGYECQIMLNWIKQSKVLLVIVLRKSRNVRLNINIDLKNYLKQERDTEII